MRHALLRGWLYVPHEAVRDLGELRERLTYRPRPSMDGGRRDPVLLYEDDEFPDMIGVPQAFGRELFGSLEVDDQTSHGYPMDKPPRVPAPNHPAVKDPAAQAKFMADMLSAAREHRTFIACAPTGTGKTVVGANTAVHLGRTTLVLVHLDRLAAQWRRELVTHFGFDPARIGTVQGDLCDFRDKDFVVGMVQSVAFRPYRYPPEFYTAFGMLIIDEVHRLGAPVFSQAIWQFPARYRIGLSATPKRKDGGGKVFFWHLGPIKVRSEQAALPLQVWPRWYDCKGYKLWGTNHGARMKCLSLDPNRNALVCKLIQRMYNGGRQAVVMGESVRHLQALMEGCRRLGVPSSKMGQFTSEVHYQEKTTVGGREQVVAKKRKQKAAVLERIKRDATIIFATYGMFKEGIDVPRLDAGLDATPRSDATQLIGRIRRPHPGKKEPILWVTIVDARCDRSLRYYQARLVEYQQAGAEVMHHEQ